LVIKYGLRGNDLDPYYSTYALVMVMKFIGTDIAQFRGKPH